MEYITNEMIISSVTEPYASLFTINPTTDNIAKVKQERQCMYTLRCVRATIAAGRKQ